MPNYPWLTHALHVQAEKAERLAKPALGRRRWTDKDDIAVDFVIKHDWPEIPKGVGADFEGERFLRVFIEITDGSEQRPLAPEAVLYAKLSGADAVRAGLTKDDEFLVVPDKFFHWVAGALGFDKKVLLSLSRPIMECCLEHDDAEIWAEVVWISPMNKGDRKYRYAVLPLVGMGAVIDPQKGNPSIYAPFQTDPYRHFVWDIVDEVTDGGTSAWGQAATGGDGAATIFAIKIRLVNFLRDLADNFQEEEFERQIRRGEFDRGTVAKAISIGLFRHLANAQRIAKENEWLKAADQVSLERAARAVRAFRSYGSGGAASAITKGVGEGWGDPQLEASRRVLVAYLCTRHDYLAKAARGEVLNKDGGWFAELAEEGYEKGDLLPEDAREIDQSHQLDLRSDAEEEKLHKEWLRDLEDQLAYLVGSRFPH